MRSTIPAMGDTPTPAAVFSRVVAQPGRLLTAVPPFVFALPEGWVLDEGPSALAIIRLPKEIDGFWVNAILSHDKVARAVSLQRAAQVTWAKLQQSGVKDLVPKGEKGLVFGSTQIYVRGCEFTSPDDRALAQLQAIWFAPVTEGGKTVDLFQLVLTAPKELMPKVTAPIIEMLSTFRFT